jgi:hypothetical protein
LENKKKPTFFVFLKIRREVYEISPQFRIQMGDGYDFFASVRDGVSIQHAFSLTNLVLVVVLVVKSKAPYYLSGRFQRVTVHGATSTILSITSGVPQGSLLGPFLFSVYINDLPSYVSSSTGVGLFVDDTKLYRCIKNPSDALLLQEDIQGLPCCSNENHLHFNQSKCKILSITRKTSPLVSPYSLAGDLLSFSDAEVDLGITISPKLTWIHQLSKVKPKANKFLGLIRRSTLEMTDLKARKYLYLQLVRSNLAYASQVWCPQSVQLIENIEKVQRRATKFIFNLGFVTNMPYRTRLHNLQSRTKVLIKSIDILGKYN